MNALDGIGAQEGRLLFATTNRYEALDPALIRPGRMDLHVEFKLASLFQAREMFLRFYFPGETANSSEHETAASKDEVGDPDCAMPSKEKGPATTLDLAAEPVDVVPGPSPALAASESISPPSASATTAATPNDSYKGLRHDTHSLKESRGEIEDLADKFSSRIREYELSMASLQGYLMQYKVRPVQAVEDVEKLVEEKRKKVADSKAQKVQSVDEVATTSEPANGGLVFEVE